MNEAEPQLSSDFMSEFRRRGQELERCIINVPLDYQLQFQSAADTPELEEFAIAAAQNLGRLLAKLQNEDVHCSLNAMQIIALFTVMLGKMCGAYPKTIIIAARDIIPKFLDILIQEEPVACKAVDLFLSDFAFLDNPEWESNASASSDTRTNGDHTPECESTSPASRPPTPSAEHQKQLARYIYFSVDKAAQFNSFKELVQACGNIGHEFILDVGCYPYFLQGISIRPPDSPGMKEHIFSVGAEILRSARSCTCGGKIIEIPHGEARIIHLEAGSIYTLNNRTAGADRGVQKNANAKCFIASACYGPKSEQVRLLQGFRDSVLVRSAWGRAFMATYYAVSPSIARVLKANLWLARIVRILFISPIVRAVRKRMLTVTPNTLTQANR